MDAPAGPGASRSTRVAAGFAALKLALSLSALTPYGYFRDELYYLACADHLAFGYVDHPPFSIAVLAVWRSIFGDSVAAIRIVPALVGALVVYTTGRLASSVGGGLGAVAIACAAALLGPAFAAVHHVYSMNAFDHLFWVVAALCAVRALETPTLSRWSILGVVLGLGLMNKISVLWFCAGLTLALLATPTGRAALRTRGPYVAAVIAALLFLPHVLWQVAHAFPTAEFAKNAMEQKYVRLSFGAFARESLLQANPATLPLVIAGVAAPFAVRSMHAARPLAVIFATAFAIIASSKSGKPEYLNAAYPLVFASGAVFWESHLAAKAPWTRRVAIGLVASLATAFFLLVLPLALPILSEPAFIAYQKRLGMRPQTSENKELAELPQHYADMHGWDDLVAGARQAYATIPPEERAHAKVWAATGGYGPAAAIGVLAPDLPRAISTHNNYWLWGYGEEWPDGPVVVLGGSRKGLEQDFEVLDQVTTIECGYCMPYENHKPVYVGRKMKHPWADIWRELKHFE